MIIGSYQKTAPLRTAMVLSNDQVIKLIKAPKNAAQILRAVKQENRLRFHAQVVESKDQASSYYNEFLNWVQGFLTASDKYEQFKKMLLFPVPTNNVVDAISDEYSKVFNAQNSFFGYDFENSEYKQIFIDYLEKCNDKDFWQTEVFGAMFTGINSIVVVDLEINQETALPEPYKYLLDISRVVDVDVDRNGQIEYLLFKEGSDKLAAFDAASYRVFTKNNTGDYFLTSEMPHDLGYCPASFMWADNLDTRNGIVKQSPLSSILSFLDKYLAKDVSKDCLDVYAAFPIYWAYEGECDYENEEGAKCNSGFTLYEKDHRRLEPCPACAKSSLTGAGSMLRVPILVSDNTQSYPDLREPAGIISIDKDSLTYNTDEIIRMEAKIIEIATGKIRNISSKEAINEDQVKSQFESQTNILRYIAQNLEKINTWTCNTVARLMFGDQYLGCAINYGNEFYLQSLEDVTKDYQTGKASGLPSYILLSKRNQIEELQSKNNPTERDRLHILKYLEPYADLTPQECKSLGIDQIDFEGFALKVNFTTFIHKFELEYGDIVEWGSALSLKTKIDKINQKLKEYVKQQITKPEPKQSGAANAA